jgi:hypothetical protein
VIVNYVVSRHLILLRRRLIDRSTNKFRLHLMSSTHPRIQPSTIPLRNWMVRRSNDRYRHVLDLVRNWVLCLYHMVVVDGLVVIMMWACIWRRNTLSPQPFPSTVEKEAQKSNSGEEYERADNSTGNPRFR